MSLAKVLSAYMNTNLLIVISFLCLIVFSFVLKRIQLELGSRIELKLHYSLILIIIGLTLIHPFLPKNDVFLPIAKVWSAQSIKSFGQDYQSHQKGGFISLPTPAGESTVEADQIAKIWIFLGAVLLMIGGLYIAKDLRILFQIKRNSLLIRKIGHVFIFINDDIQVRFSFWVPGQAYIIVPSRLVYRREDCKIAILHEIQHHRQNDTRWVYVLWGLKLVCIINPFIHLWNRWISEIQEFACDETLVDQRKVDSQSYARCLVEVAQNVINQKHVPACATGLTFLVERNLLKRRIEKMLSKSSTKIKKSVILVFGILLATIMGTTAIASKGLIQDRRVSLAQAKIMAERAQRETGIPVVVNDLVLKQLNWYIGTPEGRENMRGALIRMENYKETVAKHLQKYGLPEELMALPIAESGYQNLPESKNTGWPTWKAAGVWQFVRQTARNYGLTVNERQDDRMNVELLTDAAMRYLQSNNLRFKDWHLAILAYNMGESNVQKGIDTLGKRDAWALIRSGHEGDKNYLPKIMASILIMRNPETVM